MLVSTLVGYILEFLISRQDLTNLQVLLMLPIWVGRKGIKHLVVDHTPSLHKTLGSVPSTSWWWGLV